MHEIETKIVDFDEVALRRSLKTHSAKHQGEVFYKRMVFMKGLKDSVGDEFVRVRSDGEKTTLTWKFRNRKIKGLANTQEIEIEVSDFKNTVGIISKIWNGPKPIFQENKIEKWEYKGVEITICTWPLIKPFLELEAKSEGQIRTAIKELKIGGEEIGNDNLVAIFNRYGQNGKDTLDLRFEKKRS